MDSVGEDPIVQHHWINQCYCQHCNQLLSIKTFKTHKRLYYNKVKSWSCMLPPKQSRVARHSHEKQESLATQDYHPRCPSWYLSLINFKLDLVWLSSPFSARSSMSDRRIWWITWHQSFVLSVVLWEVIPCWTNGGCKLKCWDHANATLEGYGKKN